MRSIVDIKWNLRACRVQAGLSQNAVAEAIGVKLDAVEGWENGTLSPTMDQGLALSELYQIPLAFMDFTRENNRRSGVERDTALYKAVISAHSPLRNVVIKEACGIALDILEQYGNEVNKEYARSFRESCVEEL